MNPITMAKFALWSYNSKAKEQMEKEGYNVIEYDDKRTDTQAYLCYDKANIYITFRGTEFPNPQDLFTDVLAFQTKRPYGGVHYGVWRGVRSLKEQILSDIYHIKNNHQKKIYLGGHSLGAGEALCMAAELKHEGFKVYGISIWGCLRTGNKQFANYLKDIKIYRFISGNDLVPRLPLAGSFLKKILRFNFFKEFVVNKLFNYRHTHGLKYFDVCGNMHVKSPILLPMTLFVFVDRWYARFLHFGKLGFSALEKHSMFTYYRLTKRNFDGST